MLPFEGIKRTVLVKAEAETDLRYGCPPEKRTLKQLLDYGVVNIDKPKGPTTHQAADYVKKILQLDKAGHSGSLDPAVTGVVIVALGKSTKVVHYLLHAGKQYVCIMHIHQAVDEKKIREVMNAFVGKIMQMPPVKSAVKRQWREKSVYEIEVLEIDKQDVLFRVDCEAGTYIRKLVHDIGQKLGCGAHMAELRRTKVGTFDESTKTTLQELQDAFVFWKDGDESHLKKILMPMEKSVEHLPKIWIFDTTVDSICHGATLNVPGISKIDSPANVGEPVAIMTLKNELVAVGSLQMSPENVMANQKGLVVKIERVFMDPGTYPKYAKETTKQ